MIPEIGSNFWEYDTVSNESRSRLWWESSPYYPTYYKSGRNAIKALCRLLVRTSKKVLLPAYTCSTVIDPFTDEGWEIRFFRLNKDLTIDTESLKAAYQREQPAVLLLHSYFGFDTIKQDLDAIREIHEDGTVIVEDITQSLLSGHCIPYANYYVSSLRKFCAIPDGGILLSAGEPTEVPQEQPDSQITKTAHEAFRLKGDYFKTGDPELKTRFRERYQELNRLIAENGEITAISPESRKVFSELDVERISRQRKDNYRYLSEELKDIPFLKETITTTADGCTPLYYPVYIEGDRKAFQTYMAEHQVYCPVIWPKPQQIQNEDERTGWMYRQMLCIPIDQRYGRKEMERTVDLVKKYKGNE